jgi:hypothetical protein
MTASITDTWNDQADELIKQWEQEDTEEIRQADAVLADKARRGERIAPPRPSTRYQKFSRFEPDNKEHLEIALLHPERIFESETHGKLLLERLLVEAEPIVDGHSQKHGCLPHTGSWVVTLVGALPPNDWSPLVPSPDAALIKKLEVLFEASKQSLTKAAPQTVITSAMEGLRQLQSLDGKFPRPLTEKSLWGILGDFVQIAHPTTVACREMLLYEMLPLIGVVLGDAYYLGYGSDRHFPSFFTLAIGRTTDGKGQGWHVCENAIRLVDPTWFSSNVHSNCSSGEGLIRMLSGGIKITGSHKKRIAIFNTEMSTWFVAQNRKDSSLSGYLRQAYDYEKLENFRSDKKNTVTAEDYLLGMCGTITPAELKACMPQMDWKNGAQNRFLWSVGFKDKSLSRSTAGPDFTTWAERVKRIISLNADIQPTEIEYSKAGLGVWDDWHASLPEHDDSIRADSQARVLANCARVAVLYAVLDERRLQGWQVQLEPRHVEAAIEIVDRSRQSVNWYLTQQSGSTETVNYEDIQKLKLELAKKARSTGVAELTANDVYTLFCHYTKEQRDELCVAAGFKVRTKKPPKGKPVVVWSEQ